jgi:hypothetical protein
VAEGVVIRPEHDADHPVIAEVVRAGERREAALLRKRLAGLVVEPLDQLPSHLIKERFGQHHHPDLSLPSKRTYY